jgi:TonB family protein
MTMDALSQGVLTFLLNSVWQVALVASATVLVDLWLRRAPARYRHLLWTVSLAAAILLPVASSRPMRTTSVPVNASVQIRIPSYTILSASPSSTVVVQASARQTRLGRARHVLVAGAHQTVPVPRAAMRGLLVLYASFLLFMLARFARAWLRARGIRRLASTGPLPDEVVSTLDRCRRAMTRSVAQTCFSRSAAFLQMCVRAAKAADLERQVCATRALNPAILWSEQTPGPLTVGALHGAIILPTNLRDEGSTEDLEAALAHEMAHVCRFDYLCNLVCELLLLPIAFHPLTWLLKRRLAEARELACDELAAQVLDPSRYARSLVHIANQISSRASARLKLDYTLGVFDANILEERVMTLLKPRASGRLAQLSVLLGSLAIVFPCLLAARFSLGVEQARTTSGAFSQDQAARAAEITAFAGDWQAKFDNQQFVKLNLAVQNGQLAGAISTGDVNLDSDGKVTEVTHSLRSAVPILEAKMEGHNLFFKQQDGSDTLSYQMKVVGADEARLQMLDTGSVQVQPFTLHRDSGDGAQAKAGDQIAEYQGKLYAVSGGISGGVSGGPSGGVTGGSAVGVGEGVSGGVSGSPTGRAYSPGASASLEGKARGQADADSNTGSLSGIVVDSSGARIPRARVWLVNRDSGAGQDAETDETGGFAFKDLPAGRYTLNVMSAGMGGSFRMFTLKAEGQPPFFPFVLQPGTISESAVVTAKLPPGVSVKAGTTAGPRSIRIGGSVEGSKLIENSPQPVYPESAREHGIQGLVLLEATISADGVPTDLKILSSPSDDLSLAALDAVKQWKYRSTLLNGEPIAVLTTIAVDFRLEE